MQPQVLHPGPGRMYLASVWRARSGLAEALPGESARLCMLQADRLRHTMPRMAQRALPNAGVGPSRDVYHTLALASIPAEQHG